MVVRSIWIKTAIVLLLTGTAVSFWLPIPSVRAGASDRLIPASRSAGSVHQAVRAQSLGRGATGYWLFEPADPVPTEPVPLVVFLHGWLGVNPGVYGAWIEHLVLQGQIVVFPIYQEGWTTPPDRFLPNATQAVIDALDVLQSAPEHARPDLKRTAFIGHSAGGNLAALMSAARDPRLPTARAVIGIMPGEVLPLAHPRLGEMPAETLLLVVVGDRDLIVGDQRARQIFAESTSIPPCNKKYVFYRTSRLGPIPIVADHLAPTAGDARYDAGTGPFRVMQMRQAGVDILDRFGFWRISDLTLEAAFTGRTLDEATDNGSLLRDLGRWSHGKTVPGPLVGDDISTMPKLVTPSVRLVVPPLPPGSETSE